MANFFGEVSDVQNIQQKTGKENCNSVLQTLVKYLTQNEASHFSADISKPNKYSYENGEPIGTPQNGTGVIGSTSNLVSAMLGAGLLSFPNGFKLTGLVTGLVLVLFFGFLSGLTIQIIFVALKKVQKRRIKGYDDLMFYYYGRIGKKICEVSAFLCYLAGSVVFFCLLGDSLSPILRTIVESLEIDNRFISFIIKEKFLIAFISIIFIFPLSLLRKLEFLKYFSFISIICTLYIIVLIPVNSIIHIFKHGIPEEVFSNLFVINTDIYYGIFPGVIMSIGIYAYSYCCHPIAIPQFNELRNPRKKGKLELITFSSFSYTTIAYLITGVFGFLNFGSETQSDVLLNYEGNSISACIGRICIIVHVICACPIFFMVEKQSLKSILFPEFKKLNTLSFLIVTLLVFFLNLLLSLLIDNITSIMCIVATLPIISVVFIMPSFLLLKLILQSDYSRGKKIGYFIITSFLLLFCLVISIFVPLTSIVSSF